MKRDLGDNYAERNAEFIFKFVCKIWGFCPDFPVSNQYQVQQTPNNRQGLYIFYIETGPSKYPIYVGVTRRNFRQRFGEHFSTGVIYKVLHGIFPQSIQPPPSHGIQLKVKCIPMSNSIQAKLIESVLLATFDFCLNTEENGPLRANIDARQRFTIQQSKPMSDYIFQSVMQEINNVYGEYRNNHGWNK